MKCNSGGYGSILFYCIAVVLLCRAATLCAQERNLDYYLVTGLANSPLLKDYDNQVSGTSLDSQRLRATYKPQVSGISNNSYAPVIKGWGYDDAITNGANLTEIVNVNQAFVGRQNLQTQLSAYSLTSDSFRNARRLSEQELKRNITAQYITAYGDLQQLMFYEETGEILRNQEIILKKLTQNNIYRQTDYLTFLVTLKQQELQLKQLRIQFRNDFSMLNYLCGIFDTTALSLAEPALNLERMPDTSASAFFLQYRINRLKLATEEKILDYSYRPKASAFANAGYSSSLLFQPYKNFGAELGVNINVPLYDGHQKALQQQKLKLEETTNEGYRDFFSRQYRQQIAMLLQQLAGTESLITEIDEQIKYAEGLIKVNGKLLQTGDTKIADFVIAINNYLTARNLLAQNKVSRMQIINQINYWNR